MATNVLGIVSLVMMVVALICAILTEATSYWKTRDDETLTLNSGLWRFCMKIPSASYDHCGKIDMDALSSESKTQLHACRLTSIVGLIGLTGALIAIVLLLVMKKAIPGFVSGGFSIFSGLNLIACMGIYVGGDLNASDDEQYGSSLAFCIVAWIMVLVGGALAIVAALKMNKNAVAANKS